ncbi:Uma2 family endonuclease [Butyrivibrio sp. INlla16]|uniref:Uma2 family endonuclease n=1 Tax=Butyrivibrio sp. INlla16 TaxID=1520807 RepID=UPI00087E7DFF|nr:Uma2 family endonuclease [Butyrivibrio sp. INlla16]SDB68301.1 Endonuclease, Uma2 family (restriction endonuclease fold) [Butyrivibrio sp. INlla16]
MTIKQMIQIKENRGYSYSQLSEYTGVPSITLQKIFTGKTRNPRKATLDAIEKVLSSDESVYRGKAYEYHDATSGKFMEPEPVYGAATKSNKYGDPNKKQGEYTLDDYYALPDEQRVELIDGVFYDMSSPRIVHQDISYVIHSAIADYIKKNKGKCKAFYAPVDVQLDCDNKTMVQPDVLVICDRSKINGFGIYGAPDFLVEILSKSTRKKDLTIKLAKYQNAGVREYWIVDPHKRCLIIYNFMDEDFVPQVLPLKGEAPVAIYDGKLKISLDEIAASIDEFGE